MINIKLKTKNEVPVKVSKLTNETINKIVFAEISDIIFTFEEEAFKFKTKVRYFYELELAPNITRKISVEGYKPFSFTKSQADNLEAYIKANNTQALQGTLTENLIELIIASFGYSIDQDPIPVFGTTSNDWELVV